MIDCSHQGKGYGKSALKQILNYISTKPWGEVYAVKTACYDENIYANKMYEEFGFTKTDRFIPNKQGLRIYVMQEPLCFPIQDC